MVNDSRAAYSQDASGTSLGDAAHVHSFAHAVGAVLQYTGHKRFCFKRAAPVDCVSIAAARSRVVLYTWCIFNREPDLDDYSRCAFACMRSSFNAALYKSLGMCTT